ncbi:hypothetical protein LINPERPRIM_LOCUS4848, partial [Linum perenne]
IQRKLDNAKQASYACHAIPNEVNSFEVRFQDKQMVVDLNNNSCTCRKWELSGIPCFHAVSCIYFLYRRPESYVDKCFEVSNRVGPEGVLVCPTAQSLKNLGAS